MNRKIFCSTAFIASSSPGVGKMKSQLNEEVTQQGKLVEVLKRFFLFSLLRRLKSTVTHVFF
jgi:hypothetical protein